MEHINTHVAIFKSRLCTAWRCAVLNYSSLQSWLQHGCLLIHIYARGWSLHLPQSCVKSIASSHVIPTVSRSSENVGIYVVNFSYVVYLSTSNSLPTLLCLPSVVLVALRFVHTGFGALCCGVLRQNDATCFTLAIRSLKTRIFIHINLKTDIACTWLCVD